MMLGRHSLPTIDLSTVLILFRPLNDLLVEQEVTGSVQSMCNSSVMFRQSELAWGKVSKRDVGSACSPCSCFTCLHFRYQHVDLTLKPAWIWKVTIVPLTKIINCACCLVLLMTMSCWWRWMESSRGQWQLSTGVWWIGGPSQRAGDPVVGLWWFANSTPLGVEMEHLSGKSAHSLGSDQHQ